MRVVLATVPPYAPFMPDGTLPALAGFLDEAGVDVRVVDLSIRFFRHLLSGRYLRAAQAALEAKVGDRLPELGYTVRRVDEAVATLRDGDRFYSLPSYLWSLKVLRSALELVSLRHHPCRIDFWRYMPGPELGDEACRSALEDRSGTGMLAPFFGEQGLQAVLEGSPDLLGITLPSVFHLVPGLTLARLVKERSPATRVVLGGPLVTHARDPQELSWWLDDADFLVRGDGEHALLELAEQIDGPGAWRRVPNLLYRLGGEVVASDVRHVEDLDALPPPRYDDLDLGLYLSPEPALSLTSSRGCYWGSCAFCTVRGKGPFRERSVERVLDDLEHLSRRHGARCFFLADNTTSVRMLRGLSRGIVERGLDLCWSTQLRLEEAIAEPLCDELRRSGCLHLIFGLESASDAVLERMRKGFDLDRANRILARLGRAGIAYHLYAMVGFPGETDRQLDETLGFLVSQLRRRGASGVTFQTTPFVAMHGSAVVDDPRAYGITELTPQGPNMYAYERADGRGQPSLSDLATRRLSARTTWLDRARKTCFTAGFVHKLLLLERRRRARGLGARLDRALRLSPAALLLFRLLERLYYDGRLLDRASEWEWL